PRVHPLHYRGIPTYPSEAAFRLFSGFFRPQAPSGTDPFTLFMDPARSHQVIWLPAPHPPVRYFDDTQHICFTVQDRVLQKVTVADDPAGVPYVNPTGRRVVPYDRYILFLDGRLMVKDRERVTAIAAAPAMISTDTPTQEVAASAVDWRSVFT